MASTTDFTKQNFIDFFQTLSKEEQISLTKDFFQTLSKEEQISLTKELGYQKIPEKKTKKNKKHTENQPFQPTKCNARILVPETDENDDPIIHSTDKNIHFQFISVQCCSPIHENGLCKNCLKPNNRFKSCTEKGVAPFGRFNDGHDPEFYTRISPYSKEKHTYYLKGKPIPEDVQHLQTDTPTKKTNKNKTPKNNESIDDSHKDIDWKQAFIDQNVSKNDVKTLKSFIKHNSITIDCEKPKKTDLVKAVDAFLKEKYSESPQVETTQDDTPQIENTQDDTPQIENTQDDTPQIETTQDDTPQIETTQDDATQDINETITEEQYNDDDHFAENEDDDDDDDDDTPIIEIQGVNYHIIDGYAIDITTGDKVGLIEDDPDDWKSAGRKIHAKNLESLQKNM
jgi:hypothetical protein